jgi:hypothetical protein
MPVIMQPAPTATVPSQILHVGTALSIDDLYAKYEIGDVIGTYVDLLFLQHKQQILPCAVGSCAGAHDCVLKDEFQLENNSYDGHVLTFIKLY